MPGVLSGANAINYPTNPQRARYRNRRVIAFAATGSRMSSAEAGVPVRNLTSR